MGDHFGLPLHAVLWTVCYKYSKTIFLMYSCKSRRHCNHAHHIVALDSIDPFFLCAKIFNEMIGAITVHLQPVCVVQ